MYPMLEQELDTLLAGYRSVHLAFFGVALGALITVVVTYYSVTLAPDVRGHFLDAIFIFAVFSCYFGVMAIRDWLRSRDLMKRLRKETVDAVVKTAE